MTNINFCGKIAKSSELETRLADLADMAELAAWSPSAAGGRCSEGEKVQRSKSLISGTANRHAGAAARIKTS